LDVIGFMESVVWLVTRGRQAQPACDEMDVEDVAADAVMDV
jgi:hypothetical protein